MTGNNPNRVVKSPDLWQFISTKLMNSNKFKFEAIFKSKVPRKYIQVKTAAINNDSQVIVFCTAVTRIKELEMEG